MCGHVVAQLFSSKAPMVVPAIERQAKATGLATLLTSYLGDRFSTLHVTIAIPASSTAQLSHVPD